MLVQRDLHFNIANMENEVYSERSMSMHSLCSILCLCCLIQSVTFSSAAASPFNKHSYKPEEIGIFKLRFQVSAPIQFPFRLDLSNSVIVGEMLLVR